MVHIWYLKTIQSDENLFQVLRHYKTEERAKKERISSSTSTHSSEREIEREREREREREIF
jgi:hypothetical protein